MIVAIILVFVLGYICIALEDFLKINKAAMALITGVLCWTLYIISSDKKAVVNRELIEHMGNLSQILFFLLGAMTIVELIDAHDGFEIITRRITTKTKRKLLWVVSLLSFFLSAVLDNLTTTIVMISLVRKLMKNRDDRLIFSGAMFFVGSARLAFAGFGAAALGIIAQIIRGGSSGVTISSSASIEDDKDLPKDSKPPRR